MPRMNKVNLESSPELSYLLGVGHGDGWTNKQGHTSYCFGLKAKDLDFVEEFKRCLGVVVPTNRANIRPVGRKYYTFVVGSKELYDFMGYPLEYHKPYIEDYPSKSLRGFFDSEGSVGPISIQAYNKDLGLLKYVRQLLDDYFRIYSVIYPPRKPRMVYSLYINRQSDQAKFLDCIGFSILRKEEKLRYRLNWDYLERCIKVDVTGQLYRAIKEAVCEENGN